MAAPWPSAPRVARYPLFFTYTDDTFWHELRAAWNPSRPLSKYLIGNRQAPCPILNYTDVRTADLVPVQPAYLQETLPNAPAPSSLASQTHIRALPYLVPSAETLATQLEVRRAMVDGDEEVNREDVGERPAAAAAAPPAIAPRERYVSDYQLFAYETNKGAFLSAMYKFECAMSYSIKKVDSVFYFRARQQYIGAWSQQKMKPTVTTLLDAYKQNREAFKVYEPVNIQGTLGSLAALRTALKNKVSTKPIIYWPAPGEYVHIPAKVTDAVQVLSVANEAVDDSNTFSLFELRAFIAVHVIDDPASGVYAGFCAAKTGGTLWCGKCNFPSSACERWGTGVTEAPDLRASIQTSIRMVLYTRKKS